MDGINTGASVNGAGVSGYVADLANAQEVAFTTSGGLGEAEVGGPTMSIVPKTGGNTFKGSFYTAAVSEGMVGDNYTDELKAAGLTVPGQLLKLWDFSIGVGGPVMKDRLWFYAIARRGAPLRSGNVGEQECRRRDKVDVRARPDAPIPFRGQLRNHKSSLDHSGVRTQQDRCLLGRAETVLRVYMVGARRGMSRTALVWFHLRWDANLLARGGRHGRWRNERRLFARVPARAADHLVLASVEPVSHRRGIRHLPQSIRQHGAAGQSDARHGASQRTVRCWLSGQRGHSESDVPRRTGRTTGSGPTRGAHRLLMSPGRTT